MCWQFAFNFMSNGHPDQIKRRNLGPPLRRPHRPQKIFSETERARSGRLDLTIDGTGPLSRQLEEKRRQFHQHGSVVPGTLLVIAYPRVLRAPMSPAKTGGAMRGAMVSSIRSNPLRLRASVWRPTTIGQHSTWWTPSKVDATAMNGDDSGRATAIPRG